MKKKLSSYQGKSIPFQTRVGVRDDVSNRGEKLQLRALADVTLRKMVILESKRLGSGGRFSGS